MDLPLTPETLGRYKARRSHEVGGVCDTLYALFSERYWPIAKNNYSGFVKQDPIVRLIRMLSSERESPVFDFALVLRYKGGSEILPSIRQAVKDGAGRSERIVHDDDPLSVRDAFERNLDRMAPLATKGVSIVMYVMHYLSPSSENEGHAVLVYFDRGSGSRWRAYVRDPNGSANWGETLEHAIHDLLEPVFSHLDVSVPSTGYHFNFALTERERRDMFAPFNIVLHTSGWCALMAFAYTADVMCSGRGRKRVLSFEDSSFAREFLPTPRTSVAFMLSVVTSMLYLPKESEQRTAATKRIYWFDKETERILRERPKAPRKKKTSARTSAMGGTRRRLTYPKKSFLRSLFERKRIGGAS